MDGLLATLSNNVVVVGVLLAVLVLSLAVKPIRELVLHPQEAAALFRFLVRGGKRGTQADAAPKGSSEAQRFCYAKLVQVSRSFAAVIMELPEELREAVLVFYLVLRGLDSVEDDMTVPIERKRKLLVDFHENTDAGDYSLDGIGEKETERDLLRQYSQVCRVYATLRAPYRAIIKDICRRMGAGMAEFTEKDVKTVADYELYCHYVAGLVGIGLSRLFGESGLEAPAFSSPAFEPLSNSMGLFLQKTNISRDYREDIDQVPSRVFYPRSIWARYTDDIALLREPQHRNAGVACVNHMVADAMRHAPASLDYLSRLRQPDVFRFCAIPQAMAIATLCVVYNNPKVLEKVVKIRKGEAVLLIEQCNDFAGTVRAFAQYSRQIRQKVDKSDPTATQLLEALDELDESIESFQS